MITPPPLPADAPEVLAELKRITVSQEADEDIQRFAHFLVWAQPYFQAKHIKFFAKAIEFDMTLTKLFMAGLDSSNVPNLVVYEPEMNWLSQLPIKYVGIHFKSRKLVLTVMPNAPLSVSYIIFTIDIDEKINLFKNKDYIKIQEIDLLGKPNRQRLLPLAEIESGFFGKRKRKKKM